ncbi:MAG: pyridoxal-dependent decarboxylase [Limnoraphis robusta]|uniref:pyridoxal-dependent decarboxylase n=1 Tax=Limnoraphis robusta TaxID=1118279 RepID=UPI00066EBB2B|nr:pyridoxal-dependent decarboxylase [Limnoraphis robusta]
MNLSELPQTAFIDPQGKNRQEIEQLASQILDLILSHLATAVAHSPLPEIGDLTDFISIPETSTPESVLLEKLNTIIKSSTNAANPGYMGHMDSMPTTISILAELVAAALNNNMLSVEMSPVFSRLEFHLIKQFAQRFGLGKTSGGVMASGGTLANLQALTVARNRAFDSQKSGIWNQTQQPVLFASEVAHTSLQKAAILINESYQLTDYLFQELSKIQDLEVVSQPDTNIICFRSIPANILPEDQDKWNADLQAYLLQNANIFLSLPLYRGQRWLRIILLNPYINQTQLDNLIQQINTFTRVRLTHS